LTNLITNSKLMNNIQLSDDLPESQQMSVQPGEQNPLPMLRDANDADHNRDNGVFVYLPDAQAQWNTLLLANLRRRSLFAPLLIYLLKINPFKSKPFMTMYAANIIMPLTVFCIYKALEGRDISWVYYPYLADTISEIIMAAILLRSSKICKYSMGNIVMLLFKLYSSLCFSYILFISDSGIIALFALYTAWTCIIESTLTIPKEQISTSYDLLKSYPLYIRLSAGITLYIGLFMLTNTKDMEWTYIVLPSFYLGLIAFIAAVALGIKLTCVLFGVMFCVFEELKKRSRACFYLRMDKSCF